MGLLDKLKNEPVVSTIDYVTYYKGEENLPQFVQRSFDYLDPFLDQIKKYSPVIAGGVFQSLLRREEPRDIDIFVEKDGSDRFEESPWEYSTETTLNSSGWDNGAESTLLTKASMPDINMIVWPTTAKTPEAVLDTFDFTVCAAAITSEKMIWHPDWEQDSLNRRLRYITLDRDLYSNLQRFQKYSRKGYVSEPEDLEALADYIHSLDSIPNFRQIIEERRKEQEKAQTGSSNKRHLEDPYRYSGS